MRWLDVLLEEAKGPASIQSIIFSTDKFNLDDATRWLRDHDFWGKKIEEPDNDKFIRLMQVCKDEFAEDGISKGVMLKSIDFADGVQAMIGVLKSDVGVEKLTPMPARTEDAVVEVAEVVHLEDGDGQAHVDLSADIVLESTDEAKQIFRDTGMVRGWMPIIDEGKDGKGVFTLNDNRYTRLCAENLRVDVDRMLRSKTESSRKPLNIPAAPWPAGVMYPSHEMARDRLEGKPESVDDFRQIAAQITGTRKVGSVTGVLFETIPTGAGKDMAVLMERGIATRGSLRGLAKDQKRNERWRAESPTRGYDVDRLRIETIGTDWTFRPGARDLPPAQLESAPDTDPAAREEGTMDLKELKDKHPELYAQLVAQGKAESATDLAAVSAQLESERTARTAADRALRETAAKNAGKAFVEGWRETTLKAERALNPASKALIVTSVLESVQAAAVVVATEKPDLDPTSDRFKDALAGKAEPILKGKLEEAKTFAGQGLKERTLTPRPEMSRMEAVDEPYGPRPTLSLQDDRIALIESENEMVGLPRRSVNGSEPPAPAIKDVILSRMLSMPVFESNAAGGAVHVIDKYLPGRRAIAARMLECYENVPFLHQNGQPFNHSDRVLRTDPRYEESRNLYERIQRRERLEAGEMDTLGTLGPLLSDIRSGIMEASVAMSKSMGLVNVAPSNSETYEISEKNYERLGQHFFGSRIVGAAFSAVIDEGAVTRPDRVFVQVDTVFDVETIVTVTGTTDSGDTMEAYATIKTTDAVNTKTECRPQFPGTYFKDISDISFAGAATVGKVSVYVPDPLSGGTELAPSGRGRVWLTSIKGTVETWSLEAIFTWIMLENAVKSLAAHGPGRFDSATEFARSLSKDWATETDRRFFEKIHDPAVHDASNDMTMDGGSGAAKEDLHEYLFRLAEGIEWWSHEGKPTHLLISSSDTHKLLWIKKDLITFFERRAEAFFSAMAWGVVGGMTVVDMGFQYVNKMSAINQAQLWFPTYIPFEMRGPFSYVGGQMTETFVARSRSSHVFTKPRTRGNLTIKGF